MLNFFNVIYIYIVFLLHLNKCVFSFGLHCWYCDCITFWNTPHSLSVRCVIRVWCINGQISENKSLQFWSGAFQHHYAYDELLMQIHKITLIAKLCVGKLFPNFFFFSSWILYRIMLSSRKFCNRYSLVVRRKSLDNHVIFDLDLILWLKRVLPELKHE